MTTWHVWRLASFPSPRVALIAHRSLAWRMRQVGMLFGLKSCFYDGNENALKSLAEQSA